MVASHTVGGRNDRYGFIGVVKGTVSLPLALLAGILTADCVGTMHCLAYLTRPFHAPDQYYVLCVNFLLFLKE